MKKADVFIILLAAALSLLPLAALAGGGAGDTVTVTVDGETVYAGPLSQDTVVELPGNRVRIQDGAAIMEQASCPDGLCLRGGKATAAHPIVCLPHKVVVTVTAKEETGLDGVAY